MKEKDLEKFSIVSTGTLAEDIKKMDIKMKNLPNIEVKEVVIQGSGNFLNLKDNIINIPIEMIVFPFFTPQKQNKRINFQYSFEDLGVTMFCTLVAKDANDKVYQPSIFEEKIYNFLISLYESKKDSEKEEEYIEFEIADFIVRFLGNKMNRVYYSKVEQALKNLKSTEYQFVVSNHTKFGKYKFEDEEFKLLNYQKLKFGKKIYYRVVLNKNIRKKIKDKRYIKYNSKTLMEIISKDPIAGRIYKYISKIRYQKKEGIINLRTLAAIIPLRMEQETERISKTGEKKIYVLNRGKQVLQRVLKAFELLKKLGYLDKYSYIEKPKDNTFYIEYIFNLEKDGECHISSFIENNSLKKIDNSNGIKNNNKININYPDKLKKEIYNNIDEAEVVEKKKIIEIYSELPENITNLIHKAKRNIYVSRSWDKRTDNKIKKIYNEDGEKILEDILKILYKDLNTNIKTTLVQYINGILKKILKETDPFQKQNLTLFNNDVKEKVIISKKKIKQARKGFKKSLTLSLKKLNEDVEISKDILMDFNEFDEYEKLKIEEEAIKLCSKDTGTEEKFLIVLKNNSEMIYLNTIKKYIGVILEKKNKNS